MAPRIVLIRHAQALHNVNKEYDIHDPPLTELGVEQCALLRQSLRDRFASLPLELGEVAIIASPMRRTLQTAQLSLDWLVDRGIKIVANADWQDITDLLLTNNVLTQSRSENSDKPCDTGSPISDVSAEFPSVDYGSLDPVYPDKTSAEATRYAHTRSSILSRGKRGLADLYSRPEKIIFVVSHSGFLRVGVVGWWFANADYRLFDFVAEKGGEGQFDLIQDETTLAGGLGLSRTSRATLGEDLPESSG
uniref:Phosphoglycerate mutase n=1 Tax=Bionectria ochroleuca TaxID=29856 RepID=A0A0B7KGD0_BIOOC